MQQQYNEKEGEVSILRAQLRETKSNLQSEQQKLRSEWKQKLTQTERQMKSVKSELEFKVSIYFKLNYLYRSNVFFIILES